MLYLGLNCWFVLTQYYFNQYLSHALQNLVWLKYICVFVYLCDNYIMSGASRVQILFQPIEIDVCHIIPCMSSANCTVSLNPFQCMQVWYRHIYTLYVCILHVSWKEIATVVAVNSAWLQHHKHYKHGQLENQVSRIFGCQLRGSSSYRNVVLLLGLHAHLHYSQGRCSSCSSFALSLNDLANPQLSLHSVEETQELCSEEHYFLMYHFCC